MSEITMIGVDLAKHVFQLHGACTNGAVIFRKKTVRCGFSRDIVFDDYSFSLSAS